MSGRHRAAVPIFFLGALLGCASEPKPPPRAPPPDPGEILIQDLESRLMRAKSVHIKARLVATGAINADLFAELVLAEGQRAFFDVSGTFEGKPAKGRLRCDGAMLSINEKKPIPVPPEVRDAFVLGLVRMGLMHNAALLVAGETPDHVDGGAHNWVKVERARSGSPATDITFDVVVTRRVRGEALLSLDAEGRPVLRTQAVRFDIGEMKVKERYDLFAIDQPIDDALFQSVDGSG